MFKALTFKALKLRSAMNPTLKSALIGSFIALAISGNAHAQTEDYMRRAEEAVTRGESLTAIQLYQSAIISAPATIEPYLGIAEFYAYSEQPDLAEKYFDIALELDPANPPALKGLALVALSQGDVEAAEARHEILVEACAPSCPEAAEVRSAISANASSAVATE